MSRRILSLFLTLVLCLGMTPVTSWAVEGAEIEGWSDPSQNDDESLQVGWSAQGNFDISWYTEGPNTANEYVLYDAADLAGLAVIVNGAYKVKGDEDWYNVSAELSGGDAIPKPNGSSFKEGEGVQDDFAGKTIVLAANTTFDLSGKVWVPIGYDETFRGTFKGSSENGTRITGMTIRSSSGSVGLFGRITGATIQNVTVENADIMAELENLGSVDGQGAGGIVGYTTQISSASNGLVTDCTFSGSIQVTESSGDTSVGGIVGHLEGSKTYAVTVANCVSAAEITGKGGYIGGVVGWNDGYATITGCRNDGSIILTTGSRVGGVVGYTRGDVTDCVNNGAVTRTGEAANGGYAIGGIAGVVQACELEGCVNNGAISVDVDGTGGASTGGTGDGGIDVGVDDEGGDNPTHSIRVGGVAGLLMLYSESTDAREASFINCHNRADVTGNATTNAGTVYLGGILGSMLRSSSRNVDIQRCSNTGALTAQAHRASILGGLVGSQSVTGAYQMTLSQCYNAGDVTIASSSEGNNSRAGGLMGDAGGNTVFEDCYNVGDVKYTDNTVKDTEHGFYLGGLAGKIDVAVNGSINTGGQYVGSATFTRCYNAGTVDANGQKGAGIGGITGGVTSNATISATSTSYLDDCVTNAGETPPNTSGTSKSANEMTEDYTWATDAYLGLGETKWEKQANDLTDEANLIGYLPVLKNNRQDPAPQLRRTKADDVTVTISDAPAGPISVDSSPITLTATVTGTYSTLYWTTGSEAVATVSGSGSQNTTGTVTITGPGTTVITAVAYDNNNQIVGSGYVTLEVHGSPVSQVTISGLTAPVQGAQPVDSASVASTAYYTLDEVEWTGTLDNSGMFKLDESYTAVFTLSPKTGCSFESTVDVTLADMKGDDGLTYSATAAKDGDNLTVRVQFASLPHTHKWASYWSHNDTTDPGYHWHNCLNDGCDITENSQKDGYASHSDETMLWRDDDNGNHYLKCYVCGATYGTEQHESDDWQVDTQTNQHYQVCDTCGKIFNQGDHEAGEDWYERDDAAWGYHTRYQECKDCGAEMKEETHPLKNNGILNDYRYWFKDDTTHWQECETCGKLNKGTHESGYVEYNVLTHRAGCPVCGYVAENDKYTYLPHVDTDGDRVCDDCGAAIGYAVSFYDSNGTFIRTGYTDTNGKLAEDQWPEPGTAPEDKVFIGWYNNNTGTGGTRYTPDSKFTYSWTLYPRWGDYHTLTVSDAKNGKVEASKTTQLVVNDTVTLTVTPSEGYRLKEGTLQVVREDTGASISCIKQSDGTYTFTMPDADVTVSAEFEERPALYFINPPQWIFTGPSQNVGVFYEGADYVNLNSSDQNVAMVVWNTVGGKLSINPKNPGTVTITATSNDDSSVTDSFTLTVYAPISSAAIAGLTVPVYGKTPVTADDLTVSSDGGYTVTSLVWQDENGGEVTGTFAENTAYTAVIALKAQDGYRFRDTAGATVDGKSAGSNDVSEDGMTMTVRMTFSKTGHEHVWGEWTYAGTQHYRQCTVDGCSAREYEAHTVFNTDVWKSDALHHYNICDLCNGAVNRAYHTGEGGEVCPVCSGIIGYKITLNAGGGTCAITTVYTNTYGYLDGSNLPIPTNGNQTFSGWYTQETGGSHVTGQYRFQSDTVLYARWGEAQQYNITVTAKPEKGGTVTASAEQAEANTTVTLTVTPADGYRLKALTVLDDSGNPVSVNNYSFTMPASDVEVTAEFEPVGEEFAIQDLPQSTIYVGDTFQLTTSGGSGSGTVTWTSSAESVATVDSDGNVKAVGAGQVAITAQRGGEQDQVSFTVFGQAIDAVTISNLKAPVQGEAPAQNIQVPVNAHYKVLTQAGVGESTLDVQWKDETGNPVKVFEANKIYTVIINLQAKDGCSFGDRVDVTLESLQESAYRNVSAERDAAGHLVVTVTFNATDHVHKWDTEWSSDPLHHWYECLADDCPALISGMKEYGYHTDSDGDGDCDDCGAKIGYTVTFDANGGKVEPGSARTDTYGQLDNLPTPAGGSGSFIGWFLKDGTQVNEETVYSSDTTVYARWKSSGGGTVTYPVTVEETEHGMVAVSTENAARDDTVTVTVTPDEGYELSSLTVTDGKGAEIKTEDKGDGKYIFTMPAGKVTVRAVFAEVKPDYAACGGGEDCPLRAFTDLDVNAWYHDGVHFCLDNGMMEGYGDGIFGPDRELSRGMLVQILYNCEGRPAVSGENVFRDVNADAWYADAVVWAAENGIVDGYGNGNYGPDDSITREQLATILYRYAQYKDYDVSVGEDTDIFSYTDAQEISEYAVPAMRWACGSGVIRGVTESLLAPGNQATRAQTAAMLQRFCESVAYNG